MFESLIDDLKYAFRSGNVVTRIIIANVAIFVLLKLFYVFTFHVHAAEHPLYTALERSLSISSDPIHILKNPWSIITHMFLHTGTWHLVWNMLLLYWFGRITGDFLGDRRVLPFYILAGLFGMIVFLIAMQLLPVAGPNVHYAMGASGAILGIILCAAVLSPDYILHLMILGPIKLKYVAAVIIFFDIVGTAGFNNTGGHFAHLGGAIFGMIYVYYLRKGNDLTEPIQSFFQFLSNKQASKPKRKDKYIKVVHRRSNQEISNVSNTVKRSKPEQQVIDEILEKIKRKGIENLTEEEKDILYKASKK